MKINPEIMSFAMAHLILTTIFSLGSLVTIAFAVKKAVPVAGKVLDYIPGLYLRVTQSSLTNRSTSEPPEAKAVRYKGGILL